MRIAIIGSGAAGLVCAHRLHADHEIQLFEADDRIGGHVNTVRAEVDGRTLDVDTGFIVHNAVNYPRLVALFDELGVATQPSEMTFSVSCDRTGYEWAGTNASTVFADRRRLGDPRFWRLLADIASFNRAARRFLREGVGEPTIDEFVASGRWTADLADLYLTPLGASIWSADPRTFGRFPARALLGFLDNHGLLRTRGRPVWRTVTGGAGRYVERLVAPFADRIATANPVHKIVRDAAGVDVVHETGTDRFDHVVVATHADQALDLLGDADRVERAVLGAVGFQRNTAVLHTDRTALPRNPRVWSAWNHHRRADGDDLTVTYLMNRLQRLPVSTPVCVTLNRDDLDPSKILGRWTYHHPVYDTAAIDALARRDEINGRDPRVVLRRLLVRRVPRGRRAQRRRRRGGDTRPTMSVESCFYEGTVRHRRFQPIERAFRHRLFLTHLRLDELQRLDDLGPAVAVRPATPRLVRPAGSSRRPGGSARFLGPRPRRPASGAATRRTGQPARPPANGGRLLQPARRLLLPRRRRSGGDRRPAGDQHPVARAARLRRRRRRTARSVAGRVRQGAARLPVPAPRPGAPLSRRPAGGVPPRRHRRPRSGRRGGAVRRPGPAPAPVHAGASSPACRCATPC